MIRMRRKADIEGLIYGLITGVGILVLAFILALFSSCAPKATHIATPRSIIERSTFTAGTLDPTKNCPALNCEMFLVWVGNGQGITEATRELCKEKQHAYVCLGPTPAG